MCYSHLCYIKKTNIHNCYSAFRRSVLEYLPWSRKPISMRIIYSVFLLSLLVACSDAPTQEGADHDSAMPEALMPVTWTGYFEGTLPCADCPGIRMALWVRDDSTYVKQAVYMDRDSLPFGTIGRWHVQGDRLVLRDDAGSEQGFASTEGGLKALPVNGGSTDASAPNVLKQGTGTLLDRHMRLFGEYRYANESHSLMPCALGTSIPLGMQQAGLEMAMWYSEGDHSSAKPLLVEIQAHLGLGPAMEGDGQEEYLFVDKVLRKLDSAACPARATSPL